MSLYFKEISKYEQMFKNSSFSKACFMYGNAEEDKNA